MNIDELGQVELNQDEAFQALYSNKLTDLSRIFLDIETVTQFNKAVKSNGDSLPKLRTKPTDTVNIKEFDNENQNHWFMPDSYCPNLIDKIYDMCDTDVKINRVNQELELFIKHDMLNLLYYLKYLVDTMREKNIVWGVGRGSSVASYVLYLIGVHKIDSIKYDLDIHEFLKEV